MIDAKKLLDQFLNSGMATGVAAGALGSSAMRNTGLGGLARIGGLALIGTLAYQAWQRYQQAQAQLPEAERGKGGWAGTLGGVLSQLPGVGELAEAAKSGTPSPKFGSNALPVEKQNELGLTLFTAMIAAAKADGEVDEAEARRIFGQMEQAGLTAEEKSFVLSELTKPLNVDDVVKKAKNAETAAQIYTASALMIDEANPREHDYLRLLADRLKLDPAFIEESKRQVRALN